METKIDRLKTTDCTGCHACAAVCPAHCIAMRSDEEGFWYPSVNGRLCVRCGRCEKICPVRTRENSSAAKLPLAYAAINGNEEARLGSSSGGVFTWLAEYVIEQGGVVFGAAFNDRFEVEHTCVDDTKELYRLRGSKYVQSKIGTAYCQAKAFLERGRMVLFTGTPCQIGGLCAYLGREYENLICQDIICHGVPSPMVWKKYIAYREKEAASKTRRMFFRHKKYGWKTYSVLFEFANDTEYARPFFKDLYMKAFLSNYCLRPSCYECKFKTMHRRSDVTLADFWGIGEVVPELDDDKGTSLLLMHSPKAMALLGQMQSKLTLRQVDCRLAVYHNSAMTQPASRPEKRDAFLRDMITLRFDRVVNKYCKPGLAQVILKINRKIKQMVVR